jgi:predicted glycosyltransferase
MKKILVYSHDTYGLGNLRRMLSICHALNQEISQLSILLISGSPMVHEFRLVDGIDYIKLPCLTRTDREDYAVKSLRTDLPETIKLRSDLILAAAANFQPDVFLVDKKPFGIKNELQSSFQHLKNSKPEMKAALILRDILDTPESTINIWNSHEYFQGIDEFYDQVLVLGEAEIFDPRYEYQFPKSVADKVKFCGYTRREAGNRSREEIRKKLQLDETQQLVLVTLGGGEDAFATIEKYLEGASLLQEGSRIHSLVIYGPEMKEAQRQALFQASLQNPNITLMEFTNDLMSYLNAADLVVAMGGYNTICEVLSLRKKAIVIPRVAPVQEQLMRAEKMSHLGFFKWIHPTELTSIGLMNAVQSELNSDEQPVEFLSLSAHQNITECVSELLSAGGMNAR